MSSMATNPWCHFPPRWPVVGITDHRVQLINVKVHPAQHSRGGDIKGADEHLVFGGIFFFLNLDLMFYESIFSI